ncbi:hypothetical protein Tco_0681114, partial [Tanacetum coccineum]
MARYVSLEELVVVVNSRVLAGGMLVYFERETAKDIQFATCLTKLREELLDCANERQLFIAKLEGLIAYKTDLVRAEFRAVLFGCYLNNGNAFDEVYSAYVELKRVKFPEHPASRVFCRAGEVSSTVLFANGVKDWYQSNGYRGSSFDVLVEWIRLSQEEVCGSMSWEGGWIPLGRDFIVVLSEDLSMTRKDKLSSGRLVPGDEKVREVSMSMNSLPSQWDDGCSNDEARIKRYMRNCVIDFGGSYQSEHSGVLRLKNCLEGSVELKRQEDVKELCDNRRKPLEYGLGRRWVMLKSVAWKGVIRFAGKRSKSSSE